ncbi:hypothetical protein CRUP_008093, partial [Coryphaenoides rupestris]
MTVSSQEYKLNTWQSEQDSHGGGFDAQQTFIGMISDVHMWDFVLSPCEMQRY